MSAELDVFRPRPAFVRWKVPVFCNNDWGAVKLLRACDELGLECPIETVYGTPWCAWSSGRTSVVRQELSEADLHRYFQAYASFGVRVALTWSRLSVGRDSYGDAYCERILHVAEQYGAQVIVVDDRLAERIREKHPNVALVASVNKAMCELKDLVGGRVDPSEFRAHLGATDAGAAGAGAASGGVPAASVGDGARERAEEAAQAEVDYYRDLLKRYDHVVVRCEAALDDALSRALADEADRLEYIANLVCVRDCQFCREHVASIEAQDDDPAGSKAHDCYYRTHVNRLSSWMDINLNVSESRICELAEQGYVHAKLAGRNVPLPTLLEILGKYLFEPTGVYTGMAQAIMAEYRALSDRAGVKIPGHMLPFR